MNTKNIMIVGVGGQGSLLASRILGAAALNAGYDVKVSEVHGMSQRGGSVFSHLRISSEPIFADVIPEGKADIILSSEPMEALRYLTDLAEDGCVITNSDPFVNIKNYPDIEKIHAELKKLNKCVSFNANEIAKQINARGNMVLLGAAAPYLEIDFAELEKAIQNIFGRKGEAVVNTNIAAIRAGRDAK